MCVCDHSYTDVCIQGLRTPTPIQHNIFYLEKLTIFVCAPDVVQTRVTDVIQSRV